MKRCERCGYRNPDVAILCLECRARLSGTAATTGAGDRASPGQVGRDPAWWDSGPPSGSPPPYAARASRAEEETARRRRRPSLVAPVVGISLSLVLLALVIEDPNMRDPATAPMANLLVAGVSLGVNLIISVPMTRALLVLTSRAASPQSKQHAMKVIDWLAFIPLAGIVAYLIARFTLG